MVSLTGYLCSAKLCRLACLDSSTALSTKSNWLMSLTQGEIISLYNMVRTTADRLVDQYRCYKKFTVSMDRAATDLEDLRNMAKDARVGQDATKAVRDGITLRKAQRDIDEKN